LKETKKKNLYKNNSKQPTICNIRFQNFTGVTAYCLQIIYEIELGVRHTLLHQQVVFT
jgi:hypothetical protein